MINTDDSLGPVAAAETGLFYSVLLNEILNRP